MKSTSRYQNILLSAFAIICLMAPARENALAVDIAPMTWTTGRSDWVNIMTDSRVSPHAVGDGTTDDTAAIQSAINLVSSSGGGTVYFPAGIYKITSTLQINGYWPNGICNLVGCGLNTVIQWSGPSGGTMVWPNSCSQCRYVGLVWDGNNLAGCGFLEYSSDPGLMNNATPPVGGGSDYMTGIRHENESFRNFTAAGTYLPGHTTQPAGAILSGFVNQTNGITTPVGEVTILNCRFYNCTTAIFNPVEIFNFFMWVIDGCEFDNNATGFDGGGGAVLLNSHFQQSTVGDIGGATDTGTSSAGSDIRGQRLTSSGSGLFFYGIAGGAGFQDCWVDNWTTPSYAMGLIAGGQARIVDCTFTNPPAGAAPPIFVQGGSNPTQLILSTITSPAFPTGVGLPPGSSLINEGAGAVAIDWIPAGSMGGNVTSATQTFLKSTYPADGPAILDVTKAPYNAVPNNIGTFGVNDSTAAIQAAIAQAEINNNGSIVYIPSGFFKITSTLTATGGNYVIEGNGLGSELCWCGGSDATFLSVANPSSVTVRNVQLTVNNNLPGNPGADGFPWCDPTTVNDLKETATGASSVVYDNVICSAFNTNNPAASYGYSDAPGLVLSGLPVGSTVYIPMLSSPLTVTDCGEAHIFSMKANIGAVNVSGATQPKTGFLGLMVAEGGQGNPSLYNFMVTDNQNLLVGPYYSEQCANDLNLQAGDGTTPGHVAIEGINNSPTPPSVSINVDNYEGRLFYAQQVFFGGIGSSGVQVTQTGANPINLVLAENYFVGSTPAFTLDSGANLIGTLNDSGAGFMPDNPNPLTVADLASVAQGMDDFRQLGALNLAVEYGQVNPSGLVAYWKLDEPVGPSADSSMSGATGIWENGPTFSTDHPSLIPYADPGSISFNGGNQYINMGTPTGLPTGTAPRTICGWAKSPSGGQSGPYGYGMFASYGSPANGEGFWIGGNGTALCAGSWGYDLPFIPNFWDGNWHFIALTYDGTTAKLYADGVLKESVPETWNLVPSVCYVGCYLNNSCNWNGNIDDVRIYNRALSDTEIANLAGTPSTTGSLITGVTATSTSSYSEGNPGFTTSNNSLVAGVSGILGASDSLGDSGFNAGDASDFGNFVTPSAGANIIYNLGAAYNVSNLLIWNFSQPGFTNAGANSVTILSSTDGVNFITVGTYTFNEAPEAQYGSPRPIAGNNPPYPTGGAATEPTQVLPVNIPNAQYIKLVINSNWGYSGGLVGINEVNFLGTAQSYDLAKDFNTSSDSTSNVWSYGTYSTPLTPGTFNIPSSLNFNTTDLPGLNIWFFPPPLPAEQSDANVEKNVSSSPIFGSGIDWLPGTVSFGPYQGPAVARFTAPTDGVYDISASFQTDQIRGSETSDGTTAYVYIGDTNVFTQELVDPGATQFGTVANFTNNHVTLSAGERVDFVVGNGAFTTQVEATVTKSP